MCDLPEVQVHLCHLYDLSFPLPLEGLEGQLVLKVSSLHNQNISHSRTLCSYGHPNSLPPPSKKNKADFSQFSVLFHVLKHFQKGLCNCYNMQATKSPIPLSFWEIAFPFSVNNCSYDCCWSCHVTYRRPLNHVGIISLPIGFQYFPLESSH